MWIFFIVPAAAYIADVALDKPINIGQELFWFWPNYLFFVSPHIATLTAGRLLKLPRELVQFGLAAATVAFVAIWAFGRWFNPFGNALEWLAYLPLAAVLILVTMVSTRLATGQQTQHES